VVAELPINRPGAAFNRRLKWDVRLRVLLKRRLRDAKVKFVFSSDRTILNGCRFGAEARTFGVPGSDGGIYEDLDLTNNDYRRLEPDLHARDKIEEALGWSLTEPFVLCQARTRAIVVRSPDRVSPAPFLRALQPRVRVVMLSFQTGRAFDSFSAFEGSPGCSMYHCDSLAEQSCLIHFARGCLFFSEGDFGSHTYVPPFFGKDVFVVAPRSLFEIGTTPLAFWNAHVFRFGGQIVPHVIEDLERSDALRSELIERVTAQQLSRTH
jgi:hypothetical protein